MKFKEIEINGLFTFADKTGVYRKTSPRKFKSEMDVDDQPITSINIEVEPWTPSMGEMKSAEEVAEKIGDLTAEEIIEQSGINPAKFDPMKIIEQMKARSWRNYIVRETIDGEVVETKLAALLGNETFMETVKWNGDGKPIFADGIEIILPDGVDESDHTGMIEVAIPDVYERRKTIFRAQGLGGMDLYYALVAENRGIMDRPGKGVNRAAHLTIVKAKTRVNNRSRSRSRVNNLRRVA